MNSPFPDFSSDTSSSVSFDSSGTDSETTSSIRAPLGSSPSEPSTFKRVLKATIVTSLISFLFVVFTLVQIPETRLKNTVNGMIVQSLAKQGMTLTSARSDLNVGLGILYSMEDVTLTHPNSPAPAHIEKISFSPSILSLFANRLAGTASLTSGEGTADLYLSVGGLLSLLRSRLSSPNEAGEVVPTETPISLKLHSENFDLGATQLIPLLIKTQIDLKVSGDAEWNGIMGQPETFSGNLDWTLSRLKLPQQTLAGFKLPAISIGNGQIKLSLENGTQKINLTQFQLGKAGGSDDLAAQIKGVITLGKRIQEATVDSTLTLNVSDKLLQSIPLLQALLGMAKQPDGSFAYKLSGSLLTPFPVPLKQ